MDEKRIYLIRHAEPQKMDDKKRYLGQSDPALSEKGILQAKQLAAFFLKKVFLENPFDIYCSDLKRARQTADIIAKPHKIRHLQPQTMSALREIDMGTWDGKSFDEIKRDFPEEFQRRGEDIANFRPPGGERFLDVEKRVMPAFYKICQNISHSAVIVAHAGVNRVIFRWLLKKSFDELFTIHQPYACINTISVRPSPQGVGAKFIFQPCFNLTQRASGCGSG